MIGSSKVHERLVVQQGSLPDQTASPAELAKAYMGMGPPKTSSSALGIRNQVFKEDRKLPSIPSTSKSLDLSVAPRSTIRFSGVPELTENGYRTPRPLGRSAIYRMSRSPYFKVNSTSNVKGGELNGDGYTCKSLSQWTPRSAVQSGGKQELKRVSSVLDGDFGTVSPIRRIRQKCNLSSPSKDSRPSPSGSLLSGPLTPLSNKFIEGSTSVQKPLLLASIPPQSSETAHRLFQQLDKLLPLPTERSSKMKTIDRDGSPSKLTPDMLHGGALRSMEEIDTSKFSSVQDIGTASDSHLPTIRSFSSGKVDMVEENGRSKFSTLGVKLASETNGLKNASTPSTDANPGRRSTYSVVSDYAAPPQSKRPSFQMSAPEDSLELDDDDYNTTNLASPLTKENSAAELKKPESQNVISETTASEAALKMPEKNNFVSETSSSEAELKIPNHKEVVYETAISESPLVSSSQSIAVSSSILFRESDKKAFAQPLVSEKGTGFTFPITSDNCSHSQQPPAPIEPTPLLNQPAFQKEQTSLFSSGSSAANIFAVSSTTVGVNGSAGVKVDAGTGSELKSSSSDATSTSAEGSNLIKAGETQKAGDLFKSFEHVSSGLAMSTTSALFSFGASTTTQSPSNGSLGGPSSTSSLSTSLGTTQSETPASSIFLSGTAGKTNARPSFSSAAPVFSTVPSFQFGSGAPNATSLDKSKLSALEAEPAKTSPFSISNSTALGTSVFPVTSSSYSTAFTSSSSGSAPLALTTSGINSSTTSSSSTLGTSSLFSSMGANSSSFALSAPGSGSSIFGFSGSTQSSSSSSSLANSNSQNSTTTFGVTGGSIFGAQPIHSANGTSLMSKSSTSHLTSFSSSPTFGLNSFGVMAGGSPPSGAKPFTPGPGFSVSTGASPAANTSSSFVPVATSALFGSSSQASTSSIFGSTSTSSTSSSTGFSFGLSAPGSGSSTSISTTSSPTTGFSFGQSASGSGSSPFMFGSSSFPSFGSSSGQASGSVFSFTSANPTASSTPASTQPPFGVLNPAIGFGSVISGSPGNDQMNVEDTMTDDTNQAPSFPTFGQPANHTASPFTFGSQLFSQVALQFSSLVAIRIPLYLKIHHSFKLLGTWSFPREEASLWAVGAVTRLGENM
ncbi:nuclear pore complex protein NUP1-like [Iris pallida]|uniref:Nuclear pore complex protein NUP1-like n=1 Tax=Iris pallida TaxID=29817 RepID=A0AAX6DXM2_IRIPA|nr:nuclear pore complex protein NUP1-like [Iris pallida]